MVKVGGNEKHIKYVRKQVNFCRKQGEILKCRGKNNFVEIGGKCTEIAKIEGEIQNLRLTIRN